MEHIRHEGYLVKRAIRSGRNWKKRYFVLDNTTLWYFKTRDDSKPRGEIRITHDSIVVESETREYALEITTPRQKLIACAETRQEQRDWLDALDLTLARAKALFAGDPLAQASYAKSNCVAAGSGGGMMAGFGSSLLKRFSGSGATALRRKESECSNTSRDGNIINNNNNNNNTESKIGDDNNINSIANVPMARQEVPDSSDPTQTTRDLSPPSSSVTTGAASSSCSRSSSISSTTNIVGREPLYKFTASGTTFEVPRHYTFLRPVGAGAYGVVVSASNDKPGCDAEENNKVAIKKVTKAFEDLVDAKRILREIKLLRHFDHENVVHISDLIAPRSYDHFDDIYIVNELMETDLHRVIYSKQQLTLDHIKYFVYQILRALKYIHSANVIHRDLKPSNLLLNANCDLRVCDFGLARGIDDDNSIELTEYVVTRWYRAPEIMLACREYTKAIDVWSVGCIFAELLGRKPLFAGNDYVDQLKIITDVVGAPEENDLHFVTSKNARKFMTELPRKVKVPWTKMYPKASPDALDLLDRMLQFNPDNRMSVDHALRHPFMSSLHVPDDEPEHDQLFNFDDSTPDKELDKGELKRQIAQEIFAFHPEERACFDASVLGHRTSAAAGTGRGDGSARAGLILNAGTGSRSGRSREGMY